MLYLALGAALVWLGLTAYRRTPGVQRGRWRVGVGLAALALIVAGAFLSLRGQWPPGLALVALGLAFALAARSERGASRSPPIRAGSMSLAEARSILGVGEGAAAEEVQAAYARLMRLAHPDKGGTSGLAAQLNAARDKLLKR